MRPQLLFSATITSLVAAAPTRYVVPAVMTVPLKDSTNLHSTFHERGVWFDWAHDMVRGVNIGGWLVLEP